MAAQIPANLLDLLKKAIPGVESLIDESQAERFIKDGKFNELLFKSYLIDKKRASVYRRVSDKSQAILSDFINDKQSSIVSSVKEFSDFVWDDISDLLNAESQISSEIFKYSIEQNKRNIEGIRQVVMDDLNSQTKEMDDFVQLSFKQIDDVKQEAIRKLDRLKDGDGEKVRSVLNTQMDKFKQENNRSAEEWKRVVDEDLKTMLNDKINKMDGSKDFSYDSLSLTEEEKG